jgi:hypothetical protein
MTNFILLISSLCFSTLAVASTPKSECFYQLDPASVKVTWTAFKTTEKIGVNGNVQGVSVQTPKKVKSLSALLKGVTASGKFDEVKKSETGNPGRDQTLFDKFFSLLSKKAQFKGGFTQVKGDDQSGKLNLLLSVNGKKGSVPMEYKAGADGVFEATGTFDVMSFGMQKAHASIHQACEELHKGKDGISKTWTEVGLKIVANIQKDCAQK